MRIGERKYRQEKKNYYLCLVTIIQLRLAVEIEERRARLENDAATKRLRLAMEMERRKKARLEKMVATTQLMLALIKGVVNVGVVLSLKLIWQLFLSFKLIKLTIKISYIYCV